MWPFRRKSNKSPIPNEVEQYYQAERRERVGVAWLLALATLVTTVLLAAGLFFGGRWVYRKVVKQDKKPATTQTTKSNNKGGNQPAKPDNKPSTPPSGTPQNPPSQNNADNNNDNNVTSDGSDDNDNSGTVTAPGNATTNTPNPPVAKSGNLANTGPGDTVAIFVGVSTVAAVGHNLMTRRRLAKD